MDYYYRYGTRQTTEACPEAVLVMSVQSIVGVVISSCMAGIVFAKLARPKNRSHTVMFSKNAVVTQARSSFLCIFFLLFWDISKNCLRWIRKKIDQCFPKTRVKCEKPCKFVKNLKNRRLKTRFFLDLCRFDQTSKTTKTLASR